jgi:membrane-associated protease RseP (regulator of RpoE activity)
MVRPRSIATGVVLLLFTALVPSSHAQERQKAGPIGIRLDRASKAPVVAEVVKGTTAAELGLQKGDVILSVNGTETPTVQKLVGAIQATPRFVGDPIRLKVQRGKDVHELSGRSKGRPTVIGQKAPPWTPTRWGNLPEGKPAPTLESLKGKVVVLFCYQSW